MHAFSQPVLVFAIEILKEGLFLNKIITQFIQKEEQFMHSHVLPAQSFPELYSRIKIT